MQEVNPGYYDAMKAKNPDATDDMIQRQYQREQLQKLYKSQTAKGGESFKERFREFAKPFDIRDVGKPKPPTSM